MNTTRSSSDRPAYTVLPAKSPVHPPVELSVILLNRSSWIFRPEVLDQLLSLGFADILSVETLPVKFDAEALADVHPQLRFLLLTEPLTPGEQLNLAAAEVWGDKFLVLWDDQRLADTFSLAKAGAFLSATELCLCPELRGSDGVPLPTRAVPAREGGRFRLLSLPAETGTEGTLFPYDYTGIYDRRKFLQSGGFDSKLSNHHWQKVDWGTRVRLWGERICCAPFRIEYRAELPVENVSYEDSYRWFYLKNLALRFNGESGELSWFRFPSFLLHSAWVPWKAFRVFREVHQWVFEHKFRFKMDSRGLVELWGEEE